MRTDILMITYQRPEYVRLSLARLLQTCDEHCRVWLWHNGNHAETLQVVRDYLHHPRVHRFHHSRENARLRVPTNWLWQQSDADYLSKVDDDCLVSPGWIQALRGAHADVPEFGVIGSWRFLDEDFDPDRAAPKIRSFAGEKHQLLRNLWVQGSGYLAKREMIARAGPLGPRDSFTSWCIRASRLGWVNGWYYPFLPEDHMDDPRSPHTMYRTDEDLRAHLPLSARTSGIRTLADWEAQMRRSAVVAQTASLDPRQYTGWRRTSRNLRRRALRALGRRTAWDLVPAHRGAAR
ncbi:MAG: glycosyltransferase family 2 protein [Micromonosporaceae bacterium]